MTVSGAVVARKPNEVILKEVALHYLKILRAARAVTALTELESLKKLVNDMQVDCLQLRNVIELETFWVELKNALNIYNDILKTGGFTQKKAVVTQWKNIGKRIAEIANVLAPNSEAVDVFKTA